MLRGARGPGHDMIIAQLHGAKPEYTGVVAGMSGSPVYIGDKLLGSLSYRIGQFSKDPIGRHHTDRADDRSPRSADPHGQDSQPEQRPRPPPLFLHCQWG